MGDEIEGLMKGVCSHGVPLSAHCEPCWRSPENQEIQRHHLTTLRTRLAQAEKKCETDHELFLIAHRDNMKGATLMMEMKAQVSHWQEQAAQWELRCKQDYVKLEAERDEARQEFAGARILQESLRARAEAAESRLAALESERDRLSTLNGQNHADYHEQYERAEAALVEAGEADRLRAALKAVLDHSQKLDPHHEDLCNVCGPARAALTAPSTQEEPK